MSSIGVQQLRGKAIAELINIGHNALSTLSDSAKLDTEILLCFVLQKSRSYLLTWPDKCLDEQQLSQFSELLLRRNQGEPIAYITGQREFWSLSFFVSPATLIPRPDTEVLVELVLENHQTLALNCLDLGTGTGAIALALASERKSWKIDAVDYNEEAVELAKRNALNLNLAGVNIYQSDWYSNISTTKTFDVIVSNPPYIDENDHHLGEGDVRFEPKSALVAPENGLADIKLIARNAITFFGDIGYLYIEHGFEQTSDVNVILAALGYQKIRIHKDYNNNDRITSACYIKTTHEENRHV